LINDPKEYSEIIRILSKTLLFNKIDAPTFKIILDHFSVKILPKKSVIFSDEINKYLYIIIEGRAKLSCVNEETGREYIIDLLEIGDIFNAVSFFDNNDEIFFIETIDDLKVLQAELSLAKNFLDINPTLNQYLLPYFGRMMRTIENNSSNLALYDTMTRLARLLLKYIHTEEAGKSQLIPIRLIADLPHETIAQMIGTARKIVNINLQHLKKEHIIAVRNGKLYVTNIQKLILKAKI